MVLRPTKVLMAAILLVVAFWASVYLLAYLSLEDPDPDPFKMTLVVSGTETNATDGNLTDVVLWVAVAKGEPRPRWEGVDVSLEHPGGNVTLLPPRYQVDDLDGNGRVSEGDMLSLHALSPEEARGTVTLASGGRTIGTVRL
jgi:hypothetical protein